MKRFALALDLVDDPILIEEYIQIHKNIWPEIALSIRESGIVDMEIYKIDERLFMVMETVDHFSFEQKMALDLANPKVQEWENLMWKFQKALPTAKKGEKWLLMEQIFKLPE
jgi:L-rhamnose mutarotase